MKSEDGMQVKQGDEDGGHGDGGLLTVGAPLCIARLRVPGRGGTVYSAFRPQVMNHLAPRSPAALYINQVETRGFQVKPSQRVQLQTPRYPPHGLEIAPPPCLA